MKTSRNILIYVLFGAMTGCATMNTDFSCNKTAMDSCLTIEEVDAMTRFADGHVHFRKRPPQPSSKKRQQTCSPKTKNNHASSIQQASNNVFLFNQPNILEG